MHVGDLFWEKGKLIQQKVRRLFGRGLCEDVSLVQELYDDRKGPF